MVVDQDYILANTERVIKRIKKGEIFIYPTDTIYGIGCNALLGDSVRRIRHLKQREIKPFSIIAPNMAWIKNNCEINDKGQKHLKKLPGPYTLFLRLKNLSILPEEVNPLADGTVGVRMPNHWFMDIVRMAGVPFITTSVNLSGMPYMTDLESLDETIKNNVDLIIYEGEIRGKESEKIDLTHKYMRV